MSSLSSDESRPPSYIGIRTDSSAFTDAPRLAPCEKDAMTVLAHLPTPCLLLDQQRMDRNIARLRQHLAGLGVPLRPHLKTSKSVDIARRVMATPAGPATVSTLKEAEEFSAAGVRDILYAVGIAPAK